MGASAVAARRLFAGLTIALLLATAFGLIDGRLPPSECAEDAYECTAGNELGWLIPAGAMLSGLAALLLHLAITKGTNSPIVSLFPVETKEMLISRTNEELSDFQDEDELSGAWADLERRVLSKSTEEE